MEFGVDDGQLQVQQTGARSWVDRFPLHPTRGAAAPRLLAGEAAVANAGAAVQVLGGMGFTWDMLPDDLLQRAWVPERSFGAADHHVVLKGSTLLAAHQEATRR